MSLDLVSSKVNKFSEIVLIIFTDYYSKGDSSLICNLAPVFSAHEPPLTIHPFFLVRPARGLGYSTPPDAYQISRVVLFKRPRVLHVLTVYTIDGILWTRLDSLNEFTSRNYQDMI